MSRPRSFSPVRLAVSDLVGLGALQLAILLALWDWRFALIPLGLYVAVTLAAPFCPRVSYFLPIVTHGPRGGDQVALTFDDGPHPETTPRLLALLAERDVKATFFVVGSQCEAHPELLAEILEQGHDVGNHSFSHDVLFALRSKKRLRAEIQKCQQVLAAQGIRTRAFRPPVSITNPRLWGALQAEDLHCVHWSVRAGDRGNRRVHDLARRILGPIRGGDIALLHDCPPPGASDAGVQQWLSQVEAILDGLPERSLRPVSLSDLLGVAVTEPLGPDRAAHPVRLFYDRLATTYDAEQQQASMSTVRRVEAERIGETIASWEPGNLLEIGAGSGRFTLPVAKRALRVVAVDVSPRMLTLLEQKAADAGLTNIETHAGDITQLSLEGPFTHICSFSTFEYVADLDALLQRLAPLLAPGGTMYFTTARRSLFRFFVQLGNALRQGLWLHARSGGQLRRALAKAGFTSVEVKAHGLGLLWEVRATGGSATGGSTGAS